MDTNRYGVLLVTVVAVLMAGIVALLTRHSWADKDTTKSSSRSLIAGATTSTFGAPSTTTRSSTTVALPLPNSSTTARTATTKTSTVTTIRGSSGTTVTTGTGPPPSSTTSTTKVPTGTFDQRSDNDASFRYGPQPQDRDAGSQGPTSSKGSLTYIVRGQADSDASWHLTADIRNNTGREVRFDGGIDAVIHLLCNSKSSDQQLHNPTVTSMPAGGGVILQADINPVDTGPGTCTLYGTIHYSTA